MSPFTKQLIVALAFAFGISSAVALHAGELSGRYRVHGGKQEIRIEETDAYHFNVFVSNSAGGKAVSTMKHVPVQFRLNTGHVFTRMEYEGTYTTYLPDGRIQRGPTTMKPVHGQLDTYEIVTYVDQGDRIVLQNTSTVSKISPKFPPAPDWYTEEENTPINNKIDRLETDIESELESMLNDF